MGGRRRSFAPGTALFRFSRQPISIAKPAEAQFQAIFGVRPMIVPQTLTPASDAILDAQTTDFRVDPELGRLCVVLHLAPALRIWVVIRQHVREHDGQRLDRPHKPARSPQNAGNSLQRPTPAAGSGKRRRDILECHPPAGLYALLGTCGGDAHPNGAGDEYRQD